MIGVGRQQRLHELDDPKPASSSARDMGVPGTAHRLQEQPRTGREHLNLFGDLSRRPSVVTSEGAATIVSAQSTGMAGCCRTHPFQAPMVAIEKRAVYLELAPNERG